VLFGNSQITLNIITDGTSNTLLLGERPPSNRFNFGQWYGALGYFVDDTLDMTMGSNEIFPVSTTLRYCTPGTPIFFQPGQLDNPCSDAHYWSLHTGGANFAFCDGSVKLIRYTASSILTSLATRNGSETIGSFD
jgi:prepilin-type processing-associated H-X9-DG protein